MKETEKDRDLPPVDSLVGDGVGVRGEEVGRPLLVEAGLAEHLGNVARQNFLNVPWKQCFSRLCYCCALLT